MIGWGVKKFDLKLLKSCTWIAQNELISFVLKSLTAVLNSNTLVLLMVTLGPGPVNNEFSNFLCVFLPLRGAQCI